MARILLGVSGGIAAYKAASFVRLASKAGHSLRVLQTESSLNFVGRETFAALTGAPVLVSEFEDDPLRGTFPGQELPTQTPINHLELVANADLLLVAPATANTLAKLAGGFTDSLLTAAVLAADCPVVIAPAMNNLMYENPATLANLKTLTERGYVIIEPGTGALASKGEWGIGRLAEPDQILAECERILAEGELATDDLKGRTVLITAGGTREAIDSVRYIGNRSSGKMGIALARDAAARGAKVELVLANVANAPESAGINVHAVQTAAELESATKSLAAIADVIIMVAAVADYRPVKPADGKIKKDAESLVLELERTNDILAGISANRKDGQVVVGFAAEHGAGAVEYGQEKLTKKSLDMIVVNDISDSEIGFNSDQNKVTILTKSGRVDVPKQPKLAVAKIIWSEIVKLLKQC